MCIELPLLAPMRRYAPLESGTTSDTGAAGAPDLEGAAAACESAFAATPLDPGSARRLYHAAFWRRALGQRELALADAWGFVAMCGPSADPGQLIDVATLLEGLGDTRGARAALKLVADRRFGPGCVAAPRERA